MAISRVGTASADGSSTAVSVTHGLTILSGDVIVAGIHVNGNPTVTDNNGAYALRALTADEIKRLAAAALA